MKENCHNSRTSDNIGTKLRPVTTLGRSNKNKSKNFDDDFMSTNCDVIVIDPIHGQFQAIWKPDFGCIVFKSYIFIKNNLLSYEN